LCVKEELGGQCFDSLGIPEIKTELTEPLVYIN
jgi:hypothetical protein